MAPLNLLIKTSAGFEKEVSKSGENVQSKTNGRDRSSRSIVAGWRCEPRNERDRRTLK